MNRFGKLQFYFPTIVGYSQRVELGELGLNGTVELFSSNTQNDFNELWHSFRTILFLSQAMPFIVKSKAN